MCALKGIFMMSQMTMLCTIIINLLKEFTYYFLLVNLYVVFIDRLVIDEYASWTHI